MGGTRIAGWFIMEKAIMIYYVMNDFGVLPISGNLHMHQGYRVRNAKCTPTALKMGPNPFFRSAKAAFGNLCCSVALKQLTQTWKSKYQWIKVESPGSHPYSLFTKNFFSGNQKFAPHFLKK